MRVARPALLLGAVLACAAPLGAQARTDWGPARDGLQSRLTVERNRIAFGEPVRLCLDVRNAAAEGIEVAWIHHLAPLAEVHRIQGGQAARVARKPSPPPARASHTFRLQPGLQASAWLLRLDEAFQIAGPGTYRVRWPEIAAEKYLAKGRMPPPSLAVTIRIAPPAPPAGPVRCLDLLPWSKAGPLQTRLTLPARRLAAGKPIPLRLEMRNVGAGPLRYYDAVGAVNAGIEVRDAAGKPLEFLHAPVSTASGGRTIPSGERTILDEIDLSDYYYLRRPGKYVASFLGQAAMGTDFAAVSASPELTFAVIADPAASADGDPMGRLLAAMPEAWGPWGSPNAREPWILFDRPGAGLGRVWFHSMQLAHVKFRPKGPGPVGPEPITLYLTRAKAPAEPWQAEPSSGYPATEYLGGDKRWHVYVHVPASAVKAWPAALADIRKALLPDSKKAAMPSRPPSLSPWAPPRASTAGARPWHPAIGPVHHPGRRGFLRARTLGRPRRTLAGSS